MVQCWYLCCVESSYDGVSDKPAVRVRGCWPFQVGRENKIDRMSLEELAGIDPTKYTDAQLKIIEKVLQEKIKK